MAILRNKLKREFTSIPNAAITDTRLSPIVFRLYCYLVSRPDNWHINNTDIQKKLEIKTDHALAKYWKSLVALNLIERVKVLDVGKFAGYDYEILPYVVEPHADEPILVTDHNGSKDSLNKTNLLNNTDLLKNKEFIVANSKKSFKTFSIEDFQNEIKLNRGAANFTAQDCIDFHDYWTETDANGKMRFTREITWNTDKRMLRWKKNDRTQINGQKTSTKTTKEDVMNGGKDLLLKYAELERQKMGNK